MKAKLCMPASMKGETFEKCIGHFKHLSFSAEAADLLGTCSLRSKKLSVLFQTLRGAVSLTEQVEDANKYSFTMTTNASS